MSNDYVQRVITDLIIKMAGPENLFFSFIGDFSTKLSFNEFLKSLS